MHNENGRGDQLAAVRQAVQRAERAEQRLIRTRQSAAYVVGTLLVQAARSPRRLLRLPIDLWRSWRNLRLRHRHRPTTHSIVTTSRRIDHDAVRVLLPRITTTPTIGSLSIVGALSDATARAWSPYAAVSAALPHEAAGLVYAIDPDVVVIDTSASLPGESWSHLGDPAGPDRLVAAGALVDAAHDMGRPVVLLRMTPPSHSVFLNRLAARCDHVVDGPGSAPLAPWHPGIDPLNTVPTAPTLGLLLAGGDVHSGADLHAAAAAPRVVHPDPTLPAHLSWRDALADSTGVLLEPTRRGLMGATPRALSALAAGRRVLAPGDNDLAEVLRTRPEALSAHVAVHDVATLVAAAGAGPEPLSASEHHAALASIVLEASAPVQLTRLARSLGNESRPRSCWDIALIASADLDPADVLAQSWRPREVVVSTPLSDRARAALEESGIDVVIAPSSDKSSLLRLGLLSPYVASGIALRDPHDLLDLLTSTLMARIPPGKQDTTPMESLR